MCGAMITFGIAHSGWSRGNFRRPAQVGHPGARSRAQAVFAVVVTGERKRSRSSRCWRSRAREQARVVAGSSSQATSVSPRQRWLVNQLSVARCKSHYGMPDASEIRQLQSLPRVSRMVEGFAALAWPPLTAGAASLQTPCVSLRLRPAASS